MKAISLGLTSALALTVTLTAGCGGGSSQSTPGITPAAVFLADKDTDGINELYAADAGAAEPRKLSAPLVAGSTLLSYRIAPDGRHVAYTVFDGVSLTELYVAAADGSAVRKVSGGLIPGQSVSNFYWAPDGSRLAYTASAPSTSGYDLFSVRPDGSDSYKVNGARVAGGSVHNFAFAWSPDSSRLAYIADQHTDEVDELYTAFPDGSGNVKVSGTQVAGGDVGADSIGASTFAWAPDSSRIAYIADQQTDGVRELFITLPDGTATPDKASGSRGPNGSVGTSFAWAPDSAFIAFVGDLMTDEVQELFAAAADASVVGRVSGPLVLGGDVHSGYQWSPDGSQLAFLADKNVDGVNELFVTHPMIGIIQASGALVAGGAVQSGFKWSPAGTHIAYRADQNVDGYIDLFTVRADGTDNLSVTGTVVAGGGLVDPPVYAWAPDGSRLAFVADASRVGTPELYVVEPDGANRLKLSDDRSLPEDFFGGTVLDWHADSGQLFYRAEADTRGVFELYVVGVDGNGRSKLSGELVADGSVNGFEAMP